MSIQVENVPIDAVCLDPANTRRHSERNLEAIRGSLRRFGQVEPLVAQKSTGRIIGGNGRYEVLRKEGAQNIDVVFLDVDDAQAAALSITLNRTGELAEWDPEALGEIMRGLSSMDALGWSDEDLEQLTGAFDVDEAAMPDLLSPDDVGPLEQITFTLSNEQAALVRRALSRVTEMVGPTDAVNTNKNGNAVAFLAQRFLGAAEPNA